MVKLVVNADDFGLAPGINQAVSDAFRNGILRSASLAANGQAFEDALEVARANPGLGVGVHLVLVGESALAPADQVQGMCTAEGSLPRTFHQFALGLLAGRFGLPQVMAEARAQLARIAGAGIKLTHLDTHQHLHCLPQLLPSLLNLAKEFGIPVVRTPRERCMAPTRAGFGRRFLVSGVEALASKIPAAARAAGLRTPDGFWGFRCSGALDTTALESIIRSLTPGVHELMVHPAMASPELNARYAWGYRWEQELAALKAPQILDAIRSNHIRLANFEHAWSS